MEEELLPYLCTSAWGQHHANRMESIEDGLDDDGSGNLFTRPTVPFAMYSSIASGGTSIFLGLLTR